MTVTGDAARVSWGYLIAVVIGKWTATRSDGQWTLTASISQQDAYRLSQRPLAFEVIRPKGVWRWPVETLQIEGSTLTARLGPKE